MIIAYLILMLSITIGIALCMNNLCKKVEEISLQIVQLKCELLTPSTKPYALFGTIKKNKVQVLVYDHHGIFIIKKFIERPDSLIIGKDPKNSLFKAVSRRGNTDISRWESFEYVIFADKDIYEAVQNHYSKLGDR